MRHATVVLGNVCNSLIAAWRVNPGHHMVDVDGPILDIRRPGIGP